MPGNAAHEYEVRESVNHAVDASRQLLDTDERPVRRDQHPKQHGCIRARFVVAKNLRHEHRQGLFEHAKVYDAWIRFSNGGQRDDRKPDAHGMALKLMGVEGQKVLASERDATTQDFVLVDNPTFFIRDALEYAQFSDVLLKARGKKASSIYSALGLIVSGPIQSLLTLALLSLFQWRLPTFFRLIKFASKRIANPITTRYWSTTPFKFGETCMKFSAVPAEFPGGPPAEGPAGDSYEALIDFLGPAVAEKPAATRPKGNSPDYLREALVRTLALRGTVFLFQVQLFKDDSTTPIDDPTVEWPEEAAAFQTVAWIWIPKQVFDTGPQMAFGENLSFTPWHAIPAHEPLGEINKVRKDVYSKLSELRHRLNGIQQREPNSNDPNPADLPPEWGDDSSAFWHVLQDELDLILDRRRHAEDRSADDRDLQHPRPIAAGADEQADFAKIGRPASRDVDSITRQVRLRALSEHTTGLALAGASARGAAFAVGFLQGLASLALIRRLDYLSAVAGGGNAAAWLAAWFKREGSDPRNVERQLAAGRIKQARATRQFLAAGEVVDEEPQPLRHLRSNSSLLDARAGIVSSDAWTSILSWARNVIIQLLVLVPLLALIVVGARLIVAFYGLFDRLAQLDQLAAQFDSRLGTPIYILGLLTLGLIFVAGALNLGLAFSSIASSLNSLRRADPQLRGESHPSIDVALVDRRIVTRILIAAVLFSLCLPPMCQGLRSVIADFAFSRETVGVFSVKVVVDAVLAHFTLLGWPNFLAHAMLFGGLLTWWSSRSSAVSESLRRIKLSGASFAAGVTGGLLIVLLEGLFRWFVDRGRHDLVATFVPPLFLLIVVAAMVVLTAFSSRAASDAERAWCAGVSALLTRRAIYWIAALASILYLPGVFFAAGGTSQAPIVVAWLAAAAIGVLVGQYLLARRETAATTWLTSLALVAAQLFFIGLLGATALFISFLANMPSLTAPGGDDAGPFAYYLQGIEGTSVPTLLLIALVFGILYALARRLVDANLFSLDALEASRLTRCYLAASRPIAAWRARWSRPRDQRVIVGAPSLADPAAEPALLLRDPDPLTGLESGDDLALGALCIGRKSDYNRVYWGPHLLVNTTQLAAEPSAVGWRDLERESFLLSPLYCGSHSLGYARTEDAKPSGGALLNLTLGRALAISGAPGDPHNGSLRPGPITALLSLFSARAGSWIEKPRPDGWAAASPRFADLPVAASFGLSDSGGDFLYLSGGAEFDRLGVYELIGRRCRYIVAVDAGKGESGAGSDDGLPTLIGRCRTDFGIRIEIDNRPPKLVGPNRLSSVHVAIGQIHYGDVDQGGMHGVLVYVRLAPSAEGRFESCRQLGEDAAHAVFGAGVAQLEEEFPDLARQSHVEQAPRLFAAVIKRWALAADGIQHEVPAIPTRADTPIAQDLTGHSRVTGLEVPDDDSQTEGRC